MNMASEYFVKYVFAPLTLGLGLIGNSLGTVVFMRKKFANISIGPRNMFVYLFSIDSIYLIQILVSYFQLAYEINFLQLNKFDVVCKLYYYFNYALDPISALILVYISVDRLISLRYPARRGMLRNTRVQLVFLTCVVVFNLVFYIPVYFDAGIKLLTDNSSNVTILNKICGSSSDYILLMDAVNRIVIPFFLMTCCSVLLIVTVCTSRRSSLSNETIRRDVRFAIMSVFLDMIYVFLNLPEVILFTVPDTYSFVFYQMAFYLYYACYACNFWLILLFNSFVRKEFVTILKEHFLDTEIVS